MEQEQPKLIQKLRTKNNYKCEQKGVTHVDYNYINTKIDHMRERKEEKQRN